MKRLIFAVAMVALMLLSSTAITVFSQAIPEPVTHGEDGIPPIPLSVGERISARIAPCIGDGVSGKRYQVVYAYPQEGTSRYNQVVENIRTWAGGVSDIISASSKQTGPTRVLRFVTNQCQVTVLEQPLPAGTLKDFWLIHEAMRDLGITSSNRNALVFVDDRTICGEGSLWLDDSDSQFNYHNRGGATAAVGNGCWSANVAAHEVLHNLGAVQNSAPNMTTAFHCVDEWDIMCYNDGAGITRVVCATGNDDWLDCNNDDYFHSDPPPGHYLDTHWNVANNAFLEVYPVPTEPTPTPVTPIPPTPTVPPTTPTPSVTPTPTKPRVTVSKFTVKPMEVITVRGTGMVPGEYIRIYWDDKRYLIGARVDENGTFSRKVIIPKVQPGKYSIVIRTQQRVFRGTMEVVQ